MACDSKRAVIAKANENCCMCICMFKPQRLLNCRVIEEEGHGGLSILSSIVDPSWILTLNATRVQSLKRYQQEWLGRPFGASLRHTSLV